MRIEEYRGVSDDCLAALVKKGDEKAFEELVIRYIRLIYTVANQYAIDGYDNDDLVQEGLLAFLLATKAYDSAMGASFRNYALKCVKNRFKDILKKSSKLAAVPKSQLVSMEAVGDKSDEAQNVESFVIEREYLKTLLSHLRSSLSAEEREVFALYLKGYSYAEIAEKTSADSKKIDNILQKIKRKLRK